MSEYDQLPLIERIINAIKKNDAKTLFLYVPINWDIADDNYKEAIRKYLLATKRIKLIDIIFNMDRNDYMKNVFVSYLFVHKYVDGIISMSKYYNIQGHMEKYVIGQQDIELFKLLIEKIPIKYDSLITYACYFKDTARILLYLLEFGKLNNFRYMNSESMFIAVNSSSLNAVKILIQHGYARNGYINSMTLAAENGNLEIVKYFIEIGEDAHIDNDILLSIAVSKKDLAMVKYLTNLGLKLHPLNDKKPMFIGWNLYCNLYCNHANEIAFCLMQRRACQYVVDYYNIYGDENMSVDDVDGSAIKNKLIPFIGRNLKKYDLWRDTIRIIINVNDDIWCELMQFI